jgi:phage RecT family recombinase
MAPPTPKPQESPKGTAFRKFNDYFSVDARQKMLTDLIADPNLNAKRIVTAALAAVMRDEKLMACTPESVFDCILSATQLQFIVGKELGHAYLVPYKETCTLIIGYKGLVVLARRSGEIESVEARVVHKRDMFDAREGSDGYLHHVPKYFEDRGDAIGVYAYAKLKGGGEQWEVMSLREVDLIKNRSKAKDSGPWVTDYNEMAKKTVVRRLAKMLPISIDAAQAVDEDDEREFGRAPIDVTPPRRAELPSDTGAVRADAATSGSQAERVRVRVAEEQQPQTARAEPAAHDTTSGGGAGAQPATNTEQRQETTPTPTKTAEPTPTTTTKPAEPSGPSPSAGLPEASNIIDNADAAATLAEVATLKEQLAGAVEAGRIGATHVARVKSAIDRAEKRIGG